MKLYNRINGEELKKQLLESDEERITLSFYKYYHLPNPQIFRDHIYYRWNQVGVLGRIYVATEGINGQISVPADNIDAFKKEFSDITFLDGIRMNFAIEDDGKSFFKLKIKIRPKIVADGLNDETFDVTDKGTHIDAKQFNELTQSPDTLSLIHI